jgi:thioredoxin 1
MRLLWISLLALSCVIGAGSAFGESLLMFSADWCKYCQKAKADLLEKQDSVQEWNLDIVDIEQERELARQFALKSLPTFIVLDDDGREMRRLVGYHGFDNLKAWVEKR